jgi:hypothetical protein
MEDLEGIKALFNSVLGVDIEIDGQILSEADKEKRNFLMFIDSYREAVLRSTHLHETHGIDLWSYEDIYAKSLEGLISLTFPEDVAELILWYVYEHPLAETDDDKTVSDSEGNTYLITNSEELYQLIITLEDE